jgi:hypothetical protein
MNILFQEEFIIVDIVGVMNNGENMIAREN